MSEPIRSTPRGGTITSLLLWVAVGSVVLRILAARGRVRRRRVSDLQWGGFIEDYLLDVDAQATMLEQYYVTRSDGV